VRRWTVLAVASVLLVAACDDKQSVHVVGDSITGQSRTELIVQLHERGWDTTVDYVGGTRMAPVQPFEVVWWLRIQKLFRYGVPKVLVVGLGTNDCLAQSQGMRSGINKMMQAAERVDRVYWVNSPSVNCDDLEAELRAADRRFPDLTVLDAASHFASNRAEWIAGDGIHLTPRGIDEMARFVARGITDAEN